MEPHQTRPLLFYQELQYINTENKFLETDKLCKQILQELNFNFDVNKSALENLQNGGNVAYNYLTTHLQDFDIQQSLLNHNISEQFNWMYMNLNNSCIIMKSEISYSTLKACIDNAHNCKPMINLTQSNDKLTLLINSQCHCINSNPWFIAYNHMCGACLNSWVPCNKLLISSLGRGCVLLPELFNHETSNVFSEDSVGIKFERDLKDIRIDPLSRVKY